MALSLEQRRLSSLSICNCMANQVAVPFSVGVFGDGVSLSIVIDLENDPVIVSFGPANTFSDSFLTDFDIANHQPSGVGTAASFSVAGNSTSIPGVAAVSFSGGVITVTLAAAFTGYATLNGVLLF